MSVCTHCIYIAVFYFTEKRLEKFNVEWFVELIILYGVCVCLYKGADYIFNRNIQKIFIKYLQYARNHFSVEETETKVCTNSPYLKLAKLRLE